MKAITIRNIEQEVSDKLKQVAKNHGKSVNQYLVEMIKQNLGFAAPKKYTATYDDLDFLFGKWSEEEYKQIQKRVDHARTIDSELWE